MSEVKGNSNSSNSTTGLIHPVGTIANKSNSAKPLEVKAPILHPLSKKPSISTVNHSTASAQPIQPVSSVNNPQPEVDSIQFNSVVGSKNSQKFDPFAEQNARREEKKKDKNKKHKKTLTIALIVVGLIAIGVAVALTVILLSKQEPSNPDTDVPIIDNGSTEQILDLQDKAQEIYNANSSDPQTERLTKAIKIFEDAIAQPDAKDYIDQIQLSKMMFYFINGYNDLAIKTISEINPDKLPNDQKAMFYNTANNAYAQNNNIEKSQEYQKLQTETIIQMGGGQG